MDLLRLQKALLMCRMSADSTFLVDKEQPGYSTKLEQLDDLFDELFAEEGRKVVLFSEWTTMLDLIEPLLQNASSTSSASTAACRRSSGRSWCTSFRPTRLPAVPDDQRRLDRPEPAGGQHRDQRRSALEPGRARAAHRPAHRMGQKQPVQVFVLVTEDTIEENLLATLAAKKDLALAALDAESDVDQVDLVDRHRGTQTPPGGPARRQARGAVDETLKQGQRDGHRATVRSPPRARSRRRRRTARAAFHFLGELWDSQRHPAAAPSPVESLVPA